MVCERGRTWQQNADAEITKLGEVEPLKETAVIDQRYARLFGWQRASFAVDTLAEVELESYKPNELVYNVKSNVWKTWLFSPKFTTMPVGKPT
jgi:hypothetical protein